MATSFKLVSKIAVGSTRDNPSPNPLDGFFTQEIYLINPDGSDPQRLTDNNYGDGFPMLSPDGKKIVFDSNRLTADPADSLTWNISDLFVMDTDGSNQTLLTRGSSASWSPDSKDIVFHASASYYESGGTAETVLPIRLLDPGAPTSDSDLFVANVDDLAAAQDVLTKTQLVTNITNTPELIEHDADWSASTTTAPDGLIAFASFPITDNPNNPTSAEIYVINPDGTGLLQLTHNDWEERAPSWSPDGTQIAFMARIGGNDFEICVMNADGSGFQQLTNNTVPDATPSWSPDGTQIAWQQGGVRPAAPDIHHEFRRHGPDPGDLHTRPFHGAPVGRGQDACRIGSRRWCRRDLVRRISGGLLHPEPARRAAAPASTGDITRRCHRAPHAPPRDRQHSRLVHPIGGDYAVLLRQRD